MIKKQLKRQFKITEKKNFVNYLNLKLFEYRFALLQLFNEIESSMDG